MIKIISQIIAKDSSDEVIEEKNIVENGLMIWMACVLYEPSLFESFLAFDQFSQESIKTPTDFVIRGLLHCPIEKMRKSFQHVLGSMASRLAYYNPEVMNFLIKSLSSNFSLISDHPSAQYFDLFNQMVDIFFVNSGSSSNEYFDPEGLLGQIIEKIRAEQHKSKSKG